MTKIYGILLGLICTLTKGCASLGIGAKVQTAGKNLPFMKNDASECYYLDDFMPAPDSLVKGKQGSLLLRYYTYEAANFREFKNQNVVLAFYSRDERCWSLFEEYLELL